MAIMWKENLLNYPIGCSEINTTFRCKTNFDTRIEQNFLPGFLESGHNMIL
jgi:hypothetical protein